MKIWILFTLFLIGGCATKGVNDRLDDLDKRLESIEKKLTAAQKPQMPPEQDKAYELPIGKSPVLGNESAKVSVVIFSDTQCPFCKGADTLLRDIVKDSDLKEKVNVVFKNFPLSFHPNAKPAAKAALAARDAAPAGQANQKYWEMLEKLFSNQQDLSAENFSKWAKEIGLNVTKFQETLKSKDGEYDKFIQADVDLGTNAAQVRGTPSIYVGGWELRERSVQGVKNLLKEKNLL